MYLVMAATGGEPIFHTFHEFSEMKEILNFKFRV